MQRGLMDPHKGSPNERRRRRKTEVVKGLCHDERRTVPQNSWWGLVQMCRAGGGPKKVKGST